MELDRITDNRLFVNNTKEEIQHWCQNLQYFHYMRARSGHNCEGDSFSVHFSYDGKEDLLSKLKQVDVSLETMQKGDIAFDPFEDYSIDDLDKLKFTIPGLDDLIQPKHVNMCGHKVHLWVQGSRFEISISGTSSDNMYKASNKDFEVCLKLEKEFDKLGWRDIIDDEIKSYIQCISKERYPELY